MTKSIVVTGGAGFIGAHVVRYLTEVCDDDIVIIDKLSYAGHLGRLSDVLVLPRVHFYQEDVCDTAKMSTLLAKHQLPYWLWLQPFLKMQMHGLFQSAFC